MDGNLKLLVKTKKGQFVIENVNKNDSVAELKSIIWSKTDLHPDFCRILIGFPPQELFLVDDEQPIRDVITNNRETLILEELSGNKDNKDVPRKPVSTSMKRIEVPANNSCLFVSVYYCITGQLKPKCPELRKFIAQTVQNDPITYNEGFLEKSNQDYCIWIQNEDHWGGGIELSILSKYYQVEIVAVDTQNIRLNRFGEDKCYPNRIFLIFDGIHYDPLVMESSNSNKFQSIFSSNDMTVIEKALEFARIAKSNHLYTDLKKMTLKCNQCNNSFTQDGARSHASQSGHIDFSEITN